MSRDLPGRPRQQFVTARLLSRVQRGGWGPCHEDGAELRNHWCRACSETPVGDPIFCDHARVDLEAWKREKEPVR